MPELLSPEPPVALDPDEQESLRVLNRSPHPYHHQSFEIPDRFVLRTAAAQAESQDGAAPSSTSYPSFTKESSPASDSGTEADDEHFLKGLPAPKVLPRKGLRGRNEPLSGTVTPLLSPAIREEDYKPSLEVPGPPETIPTGRRVLDALRRKRIWVRRATEAAILGGLGQMVRSNKLVAPLFDAWRGGMHVQHCFNVSLLTHRRIQALQPFVRLPISPLPHSHCRVGLSTLTIETNTDPDTPEFRSCTSIIPSRHHYSCGAVG